MCKMKTPYSRSCNKTSRKFYDDFDLLPKNIKEILWKQTTMPTFEDLKAAWELAQETLSLNDIISNLHVFEEERKALKKKTAEEKRKQKFHDKWAKRQQKYANRIAVYQQYRVSERPKDQKLIAAVTAEKAAKMIAERKENKDVKPAGNLIVTKFVGYKTQEEVKKEEIKPLKEIPLHICKQFHNG